LRCIVVDDEPLARSTLRKLVSEDPDLELVAECQNGREAVAAVREHEPDLVVLDVQMPGMDGFQVVETLRDGPQPMYVFATAYDRFALKAFDVHAVDYLLKPFDDERFREAIERAKSRRRLERVATVSEQLSSLLASLQGAQPTAPARFVERLTISQAGAVTLVDVADIVWVEAADQYVLIHTATSEHLMRESMADLETRLDPARFMRVHRSAIVSVPHIRRFERDPAGTGRALVGKDTWIPVSRTRTPLLKDRLG
jgi:two-component system LytT family response regulator